MANRNFPHVSSIPGLNYSWLGHPSSVPGPTISVLAWPKTKGSPMKERKKSTECTEARGEGARTAQSSGASMPMSTCGGGGGAF